MAVNSSPVVFAIVKRAELAAPLIEAMRREMLLK
jgi:hypothetical protein